MRKYSMLMLIWAIFMFMLELIRRILRWSNCSSEMVNVITISLQISIGVFVILFIVWLLLLWSKRKPQPKTIADGFFLGYNALLVEPTLIFSPCCGPFLNQSWLCVQPSQTNAGKYLRLFLSRCPRLLRAAYPSILIPIHPGDGTDHRAIPLFAE